MPRNEIAKTDVVSDLLTVHEAARVLRISASSLNKWRLTGNGPPFVRIGTRVRYRARDLSTYIANRTCASTSLSSPA
jgi:excisionase family DNA binding protein